MNLPSATCPNLEDPEHGTVSLSGTSPGSVATYTCNDGMVATRTCNSDGQWTGVAPTCDRKSSIIILEKQTAVIVCMCVFWL